MVKDGPFMDTVIIVDHKTYQCDLGIGYILD